MLTWPWPWREVRIIVRLWCELDFLQFSSIHFKLTLFEILVCGICLLQTQDNWETEKYNYKSIYFHPNIYLSTDRVVAGNVGNWIIYPFSPQFVLLGSWGDSLSYWRVPGWHRGVKGWKSLWKGTNTDREGLTQGTKGCCHRPGWEQLDPHQSDQCRDSQHFTASLPRHRSLWPELSDCNQMKNCFKNQVELKVQAQLCSRKVV